MDANRKAVIIKEIQYWKDKNLLPSVYCDFLLALYTEGNGTEDDESESGNAQSIWLKFDAIFLLLLVPFSFLITHFTEFTLGLQIGFALFFLLIDLLHYYVFYKKKLFYAHIALISSMLILLITSVSIISEMTLHNIWIYISILMNGLIWFIVGYLYKYKYLLATSFVNVLLVCFFIMWNR
ncbi:hypothetical protein SAMN05421676_106146 [Salinibacillus kushneri]|uniref:Uncharacterized protein n=1 Tax=Salinibacillus kushneri TaxID=237682 RepID=A0A1I0FYH5_9BACI|nr:hypothetical protein [Salinibacillus kushneri]SET63476.1 hypothetical protein SAMN05421676_106146 [Salinibacillus kushneri]